jgi:hypothetical protein
MLWLATSWRGHGALLVLRLTYITSLQVKAIYIYCKYYHFYITLVRQLSGMQKIVGLNQGVCNFLFFIFHVHRNVKLYMPCMYEVYTWSEHGLNKYVHTYVCKYMYIVWTVFDCIYVFVHCIYIA